MRLLALLAAALLLTLCAPASNALTPDPGFRQQQLLFERVRTAYSLHQAALHQLLHHNDIRPERLELFVRAFKVGRRVEVWGREQGIGQFVLLRTYRLAGTSGTLGPKRQSGDRQIPEGFYSIDRFNPNSEYLLSLGLDYPNAADRRYTAPDPGGDIFLHGSNVTIGCLPITDIYMQELYVLAVEARAAGQTDIAVHIFPFEMTAENLARRVASPHLAFWQSLAAGYQYFEDNRQVPHMDVDEQGSYAVR
ncbi:L,D-transpeptidase family protein [Hymenobacter puniceus]|uniref:L,D-transpeptidase family protein n=1 Tax=Hymenobacter sp. BT190 TaxID=2763505 RepID=UPI00165131DC|nr:hypothetical protein [Hymenobacter sp. BT190]MBC6696718.1 hypothetical protein [Hymenobacter sp. BT190]